MGAVGHSGITVVIAGWFSLLDTSQYIEKNLNHIQAPILRGQKNLFLALRAERIIFFAWEFVFSPPTKASLNNNKK